MTQLHIATDNIDVLREAELLLNQVHAELGPAPDIDDLATVLASRMEDVPRSAPFTAEQQALMLVFLAVRTEIERQDGLDPETSADELHDALDFTAIDLVQTLVRRVGEANWVEIGMLLLNHHGEVFGSAGPTPPSERLSVQIAEHALALYETGALYEMLTEDRIVARDPGLPFSFGDDLDEEAADGAQAGGAEYEALRKAKLDSVVDEIAAKQLQGPALDLVGFLIDGDVLGLQELQIKKMLTHILLNDPFGWPEGLHYIPGLRVPIADHAMRLLNTGRLAELLIERGYVVDASNRLIHATRQACAGGKHPEGQANEGFAPHQHAAFDMAEAVNKFFDVADVVSGVGKNYRLVRKTMAAAGATPEGKEAYEALVDRAMVGVVGWAARARKAYEAFSAEAGR
jgi:hypothetical protein